MNLIVLKCSPSEWDLCPAGPLVELDLTKTEGRVLTGRIAPVEYLPGKMVQCLFCQPENHYYEEIQVESRF